MSYKDNSNDTEVQAALVVIISQVLVPAIIKSIVYVSDKLITWAVGDDSMGVPQDASLFEDVLVSSIDNTSVDA